MGDLDFSDKLFVDSCESITTATSTQQYCYSSATSFNQILIITLVFLIGVVLLVKWIDR